MQQDAQNLYLRFDTLVQKDAPVNQAPQVSAGPDQTITLPAVANLTGTASNDGLPNPPGALTTTWSVVSGPGGVAFGNSHALTTTATFTVPGTYQLRLTADDGALAPSSTLQVTVNAAAIVGPQLAPIADRTIVLGTRFQQVLQATAGNLNDTLNFALPTAPAGAALSPAPLVDWLPNSGQVGLHHFTAQVTDNHGHSAAQSFTVTVTKVNHAPQLQPQADATVRVGATFTRTLVASDPDAGDTLSFALMSGPTGMTLAGANLSWPTAGVAVGDYVMTVRVSDGGGLFDTRSFTLKLLPVVLPAAVDDKYQVALGQTLNVDAAHSVLANDLAVDGLPLTAAKLTDPDKGTLSAFNPDGSFIYQAPAIIGQTFQPVMKWRTVRAPNTYYEATNNLLAIDVDGDGKPELITNDAGAGVGSGWGVFGISALRGTDGSLLWGTSGVWLPPAQAGPPAFSSPEPYYCSVMNRVNLPDTMAVGDTDDSGTPSIIVPLQCPGGPGPQPTPPAPPSFRLGAFDAKTGAMKWLSADLGFLHGANTTSQLTWNVVPAIARLAAGETPTILFKKTLYGYWGSGPDETYCNDYQPGTGAECTVVIGVDGATGARRRTWVAPIDYYSTAWGDVGGYVVVADLTGSGSPNIVADRSVWDVNGTLLNNRMNGRMVVGLALANLDDSGQTAIISYELTNSTGYVVARKPDGSVLWETPTDNTAVSVSGQLVVADLYGDGMPKIMATTNGNLYVYDERGSMVWAHRFADAANYPTIANYVRPVVFDLDGDGVPELIMQTNTDIQFFDGRTGALKAKVNYHTDLGYPAEVAYGYGYLTPIVVDLDGDGHAEVVFNIVGPSYGVPSWAVALKSANDDWQPARPVWNQFAMHDANVTDTGHIPFPEVNNFATPRTNVFVNPARIAPPVDPRHREQAIFTYQAAASALTSNPATVTIDIVPPNRPPVFTSTPPNTYIAYNQSYPAVIPFVYQAHAVDPDPGDTITYSIFLRASASGNQADGFTINSSTGKLECPIIFGSNTGPLMFVIAATDSFGAVAYQTFSLKPSAGLASVPNVVGQSKTTADATLAAAGFVSGNVSTIYHPAPADQVLTQYPAAGAIVLAGEAIALQVSLGPTPQPIPNLIGMSLSAARTLLTGFGFTVGITPVPSLIAPAGEVIGQNPAFGTTAAPPGPVTLSVSIGPPLAGAVAQVIVEPAPSALRVTGETVAYRATAIFSDGTSRDVTVGALWNTSVPAVAGVDSTGLASALTPGGTTISAMINGVTGQATLNVLARTDGDHVTPVAQITAPADGTSISAPTTVTGTASDANFLRYELALALAGDTTWTVIGEGTSAVTAGPLGTLDPTTLLNDLYTLRLTVFDKNGNQTVATTAVQVQGNVKPGLFTLTYQDLGIPMVGLPITVVRTYDSRDKTQGDFGIGWRQGFNTLRLRTNRVPGTGWARTIAGAVVSLAPTSEHKVSIILPDGRVEAFDLVVAPTAGLGGLDFTAVTGYAPRPGTLGQLQALDNLNLIILNGGAEDELADDTTLNTFNPTLYRYTAADGTQFDIHRTAGVRKITDRNGNNVTIGSAGIIHSSGKSVTFTRDGQGRITQVTDPMGHVQTYAYDGNGDLVGHTNATGDTAHYRYDRRHNVIDVQDPAGNHATRNDYDAQGRLIAITDAQGNQITYTHNIGAATELVIDRLGHATLYAYDAMGNVIAKTDPLGHVTTYTYDARGNKLSETNPLGQTSTSVYDASNNLTSQTDSLGHTSSFTYDSRGQVLTVTDPLGRTSINTYDTSGNVLTQTDPMGNTTAIARDPAGNPLALTDPLGRVTQNEYDIAGSRTKLTQPGGNVLTFSYDGNGNLLSQVNALSPAWALAYDPDNRVTGTVLGNVARAVAYDAAGHTAGVTTATGQQVQFAYDPLGRLAQFVRPDNTTAQSRTYDAEGNVLTEADASGNLTSHTYDAAGRRIATTFPDGSTEQRAYDAAGQLVQWTDRLGHSTTYQYDAAGRQIQAVDALGGVTSITYDAVGNVVARTDPLGHTTHYTFDLANRLITTTFADSSTEQRTYDGAGQLLTVVDPASHSTTFAYSDAGALTAVTDALGHTTRYEYDSAGKRTAIVDANGNRTEFAYDGQGRLNKTTYPLGDSESAVYDIAGRPVATTNGNGQTLLYSYDSRGQLSSLLLPDGTTETYTYTPDGLIATVVDARGTTQHQYDSLTRRLTRVTEPDGRYVRYAYDALGNRTLTAHAMSGGGPEEVTLYAYDTLNRLAQVTDPSGGVTHHTYNAIGNQTAITRPNGTTTAFTYDSRNRLTAEVHQNSGAATLASFTYTLDAAGNRTMEQHSDGSRIEYDYDTTYKVTAERQFNGSNVLTGSVAYNYDAAGNLLSRFGAPGNPTFTYNANNQVTAGDGFTYAYDAAGNLVSATGSGSAVTSYAYDARGRLAQFQPPVGVATSYAYDFRGLRQSKSGPGGTINFLTDRASGTGFPQVLRESNAGGTTLRSYHYGSRLLARMEGGSAAYYHPDGLGSTRLLTDAAGAPTDTYTYSAYGQLLAGTGASTNAYRFAGEQQDAESGLYYQRARYYHPGLGRFISRDSATGHDQAPLSQHKYLYANGNPTNWTDPSGRETLAEVMEVIKDIGLWIGQNFPRVVKAKQSADNVIGQVVRATAVTLSFIALAETMNSTTIAEAFYGPSPAWRAGEFALFAITADMVWRNTVYTTVAFENDEDSKHYKALVKMKDELPFLGSPPPPKQEAYVYLVVPQFFTVLAPLPTPNSLLLNASMPGVLVHEFAHVTLRLLDPPNVLYGCPFAWAIANSSRLLGTGGSGGLGFVQTAAGLTTGLAAVLNPESHRCFVEGGYLGDSAGMAIQTIKTRMGWH